MTNQRLDSILLIKINLGVIRKLITDADNNIISRCVERYYQNKQWRWSLRKRQENRAEDGKNELYGPPLPKRIAIEEETDTESDESEESGSENGF